ncbi:hypothetical protein QJS10_CPB17g01264 [Acorus calamus]|uniref:Uncharacterized protein n=1 Tax=Acorus calamus TaxID=4465 RepID=A0AAV9CRW7_ACOCL|nr:hypothetical protein QJS10_CPB17g01264 [Acorus calamus]
MAETKVGDERQPSDQQDHHDRQKTATSEISNMEEELKTKSDLIKKHEKLIQGWGKELSCQLDKCVTEVERV